jgi:hypothetical protein
MTHVESGFTDEQLIFLVSQPRAGSTLLQSILAGADEIHTTAEPWLMLHPLYALRETGYTADYDATVAQRALQDFLSTLHDGERAYEAAVRAMTLELYGRACAEAGKACFLDKTPRYYKILPELARVFPRARFIILLRNPAAVLSSILRTWIKGNWVRFDYFRDDLLVAPTLLAQFMANFPEKAIVIHYEALVSAPDRTVRMLCDRLGIAFHEDLLQYGQRKQPTGRYGDPDGIQQHDRPSEASLDAWREQSADPQTRRLLLAYLDALGTELIARLGYDANELAGAIQAVPVHAGRPAVTWRQLLKPDKTRIERLSLILAEARRERNSGQTVKQLWRLLANRY